MDSSNEIKTVVFPVAGLGSRFLPATKVVAKELLPILNKPLIDYAMSEAIKAGIEKIGFDRGGYLYHGRVRSLAEGAREAGLKF